MAELIFNRTIRVSGTLTNADSAPTITIVRLDTMATVVATTSTGITNPTTGAYSYTLSSVVAGVQYQATWVFVINGQTTSSPQIKTASVATGYYASQSDVENLGGITNVATYSDLEGVGAANTDRIATGLILSDNRINNVLRANNIVAPLPTTSLDFALFTDISARFTLVWLYENRGQRDTDSDKRMQVHEDYAKGLLQMLCIPGRLDCTTNLDATPTAITGRLNDNTINLRTLANPHGCQVFW